MKNSKRNTPNDEIKMKLVQQFLDGKSRATIVKENAIAYKSLNEWIEKFLPQLTSSGKLNNTRIKAYEDKIEILKEEVYFLRETIKNMLELRR